jgi:putative transport protein
MTIDLASLMKEHPELVLFMLLALGYLIGNLRIGKLDLGAPPGILIAGLLLGHLGFDIFPGIETIGLFLFLYAVAFQAGPAFFTVVLAEGTKYVSLAAIATAVAFLATYLFNLVFQFEPGVSAGLLAGSITSPAGVAAALDVVKGNAAQISSSLTAEDIIENVSVTYALTYLIGDLGVILLARSLPGWSRFDLKAEAKQAAAEKHIADGDSIGNLGALMLTLRAYEVKNNTLVGKTVAELQELTDCSVLGYKRHGILTEVELDQTLQLGDRLSIWGEIGQQDYLDELFGAEIADPDLLGFKIVNQEVVVTKPEMVGTTLKDVGITRTHACYVTRVMRSGIELEVSPDLPLANGDVLSISGSASRVNKLAKQLGYVERNVNATDLLTFASGVVVAFLIGQIRLRFGGVDIGLGAPGGLLLVGILLGYLRSIHPTFGRVPPATLWVFRELGLLLFLAGVGVEGGKGIAKALAEMNPVVLLCSLVVATLPVLAAFAYGRYVLRMNPALLLGACTGAVTCTPAMAAVSDDARSSVPTIGYAGTYAFATVFSAIACSLIARF